MSYYSNELGKFGIGSGEAGQDGSLRYIFSMGQIKAFYDSDAGAWFVGQASTIRRETKWGVPQYTDDDIFVLDGVELVYSGGINPRLYHTKKQNYVKIEYYNPGESDSYWQITDCDGSKRYYGDTIDSRIEGIDRPIEHPRVWALSRFEDPGNFNFTSYYYNEDTIDGGFYLTKLIMGKTEADIYGFKAVKIFYEDEPNPLLTYREGAKVKINKRMITVLEVIGCDNTGYGGEYTSAFRVDWIQTYYTKKSLISEITQYGTDVQLDGNGSIVGGSSLPATTFEYAAINPSFGSQQNWEINDNWNLRDQSYPSGDLMFSLMDINGDGLPDRVKQGYSDSGWGSDGPDINFRARLNNGSGFGDNQVWSSNGIRLTEQNRDCEHYYYDYMDINGDGLPDRVWQRNSSTLYFKLNTGTDFGSDQSWASSGSYLRVMDSNNNTLYDYLDMNGDGKADRVWQGASSTLNIRFNNGNGFEPAVAWQSTGNYLRAMNDDYDTTRDYIDINGDGLPDRVWQGDDYYLNIRFNNGNGFASETTIWNSPGEYIRATWHDPEHTRRDYMDFNSDGLIDRLAQGSSSNLFLYLNTGNGFSNYIMITSSHSWLRECHTHGPNFSSYITCGDYMDMNGDRLLDRVWKKGDYFHQDEPLKINFCNSDFPTETFLIKVTRSTGSTTEYTYNPLDRSLNPDYKLKKWVLESITNDNGLGDLRTTTYNYAGGKYDDEERENRGFRKITTTYTTGNYVETYYHQESPEAGMVEKQISYCVTGEIINYTYNIYEDYAQRTDHYGYGISQSRLLTGPDVVVQAVKPIESYNYIVDGNTSIDTGTAPGGTAGLDWFCQITIIDYDQYDNIIETTGGDYTPDYWGYDKTTIYIYRIYI